MINGYLKEIGLEYRGSTDKLIDADFFQLLLAYDEKYKRRRIDLAIFRAEKISCQKEEISPAKSESVTTVFKLVKEIQKYI